tara:strand:- start:3822 stop:4247 length:426 start_codon:yes stop_codon:yes gene_type:complete
MPTDILLLGFAEEPSAAAAPSWLSEKMQRQAESERGMHFERGRREALGVSEKKLRDAVMGSRRPGSTDDVLVEMYRGVVSPGQALTLLEVEGEGVGYGESSGYEGGLRDGFMERFGDRVAERARVASEAMHRALGDDEGGE